MLVTTRARRGARRRRALSSAVYDGVRPHVPVETVREARALVRAVEADGLVGLGGGSAIDTCKAVVAALAEDGETGLPRIVAVPTTYAGAEWTPFFGMLLEPGTKAGGSSGRATPIAAIYDPELTLDLPLDVTVGHGDERARSLRRGVLPPGSHGSRRAPRGHRGDRDRATHCRSWSRSPPGSTGAPASSRARTAPRLPWRTRAPVSVTRWRRRSVAGTACRRVR